MLEASQYDDLRSFLQACINTIKKTHPSLSNAAIAKRLDISSSTFGRIANSEVDTSFNNAVSIARKACGNEESVQSFIDKFFPQMKGTFDKVYAGNKDKSFVQVEAESYLEDSTTHEIMMMAMTETGVSEGQILEDFGKRGLNILAELKEINLVQLTATGNYKNPGSNFGQKTVQKLIRNLVSSNYELSAFGQKDNWLSLQWESVNAEVVGPKLIEICRRATQEIRTVLNDPKSKGNDVIWTSMGMDTLNKLGANNSSWNSAGEVLQ
ncbi:MAG: hypothetical protein COW01_03875 [Bdellovibrionales bacterium CG12_big_fil_rev_8_21_14_0_65_38_15]|nr:MAG: hypothetical protein COW79_02740 [Bdellovibrionales bacterium CG22_combo_CG10-13_8_21_14_all_38_13]PIQ56755.1 MAG: hypothetical protein COW01_03875 [Bdellovibrionales bacterium CG12_big_fil_rev_8_21_14_0_65_38_15]PIR31017.1 MAG: hypothetical protein COV38_02425 [Bdellovibrionales bacterium CG11_big_fil_rev_8_21_14_0_20_38_13]